MRTIRVLPTLLSITVAATLVACTTQNSPAAPTSSVAAVASAGAHDRHDTGTHDDKGYIDGWFEGETVKLYYTKSYFCEEPPSSAAPSDCEIGAPAEITPRPGPIPIIYAIAAVGGIMPDLTTLACAPGSVCLNHPGMIDASRVGGPANGPALPHSHIISEHRGGWFQTVNIRVRNLGVWNQIAAAKTLAKVRELQADPNVGGQGLISADTDTNIFFFIASFQK
jgi:hypothetical protein